MDTVVIDFKSDDTFFTHRYTKCYATLIENRILKIELEDGCIYYMLKLINHITIISEQEGE